MLAPEKASGVLTHRRGSCLPLCLCFWEVLWLWGVISQLPYVNCLNFFFLYHFGSLHMSARHGMRAEPFNLHSTVLPAAFILHLRRSLFLKQTREAWLPANWTFRWWTQYPWSQGQEMCVPLPLEQMHFQVSLKPSLLMPGWPPNVFPSPLQAGTRGTIPVVFYSNKESPVEWLYWAKAGTGFVPAALNPLGRRAARQPKPRRLIRMSLHPCHTRI